MVKFKMAAVLFLNGGSKSFVDKMAAIQKEAAIQPPELQKCLVFEPSL